MPNVRREYVALAFLLGLVVVAWVGASIMDRRAGDDRRSLSMPMPVPEAGVREALQLTACDWVAPTDVHPNFVAWMVDRDRRLMTISSWEWDEGEDKVFDYTDPDCLGNPSVRRYIDYTLERAAKEGMSASDGGGGP